MTDKSGRIEALIGEMTLAEKIGQLVMRTADMAVTGPVGAAVHGGDIAAGLVGSFLNLWGAERVRELQRIAVERSRLKIPLFFGLDVLHGHRAIAPIPLAEAGTFDEALWTETARVAAREAAADGIDLTFAPMLDVCRDPRWGRIAESPGEDPCLASRFARAKVTGFQSDDLTDPTRVAATAKHLGGYGAVTAGREYASVDVSERTFLEVYLPAFRAAVEAGVAAIMPALTDVAGLPMTAHRAVLTELIRERWGFTGVYISDYGAVEQLIKHGVAGSLVEAAALALKAGIDIDMMSEAYRTGLPAALERGLVDMADIDAAVGRVLRFKERLGLFDDPYHRCRAEGTDAGVIARNRILARNVAARSIVLVKNAGGVLPLDGRPRRLALIGPLADAPAEMLGPWWAAGQFEATVGFLTGVREAFPAADIHHAEGISIDGDDVSAVPAALETGRAADVVILALGEARGMSGEATSRAEPALPGRQAEFAEAVLALGKPVVLVIACGRPLILPPRLVERADAILVTWFLGGEAGHALGDVLSGRVNPSARLPVTWPTDVGQIPIFYAQRATGRPFDPRDRFTTRYIDAPITPMFPFGHGLTYAKFAFDRLRVEPMELKQGGTIEVSVEVINTGAVEGVATVLLFLRDPVASIAQPVKRLRDFRKVALMPGERVDVTFSLSVDALRFIGPELKPIAEPGRFDVFVGESAAEGGLLAASFTLVDDRPHI